MFPTINRSNRIDNSQPRQRLTSDDSEQQVAGDEVNKPASLGQV